MMAAFSAASWLPRARRPRSQRHPQRFFRPQINTDWHRLRAKALSESQGNHRNRLTSVYQPERVNQGTCPCDPVAVDKRGGKFKELSTIGIGHNDEELHSKTYSFFQRLPNKSIDCNTGFLG